MASKPLANRMSAEDASFLYFEKPHAPLHIGSLNIFEGRIPPEATRRSLEERMHLIPRYRQRAVFPPFLAGHPSWQDDPEFSLDRHIRVLELPPPGSEEQLFELTGEVFEEILPRDRPLWEIAIVHGIKGDRTAYISRVHHCLVDGVSGIELLMALLDVSPTPPPVPPPPAWRPADSPGPVLSTGDALLEQWTETIVSLLTWQRDVVDPRGLLQQVSRGARWLESALNSAMTPPQPAFWNRPVSKQRRPAFAAIPFQEVRAVRAELGGTVNDAVLTIITGALGRYMDAHGQLQQGQRIRLMIPVNVRKETQEGAMGNRVSMMLPSLPASVADPRERFQAVRDEMDRLKATDQGQAFDSLRSLGNNLPAIFHAIGGLIGLPPGLINVVCTNVPGPLIPLYGSGHRMLEAYPLLPLTADLGLGVAIMSYDLHLYIGIMSDPSIAPDVNLLRDFVKEEFAKLREAAGVAASDIPDEVGVRPQPGEAQPAVPPATPRPRRKTTASAAARDSG